MGRAERMMKDADEAREMYRGKPLRSDDESAEATGPMMNAAPSRKRDMNFFGHYEVTKANVVKNAPLPLNRTSKDSVCAKPMANQRTVKGTKRAY